MSLPMPITEWGIANEPPETMIYRSGYWRQIMTVRDQVARLVSETYDEYKSKVEVVSTHTSKSIFLPVFHFEAQRTEFWLRYNFYNWNVSIDSKNPLPFGDWTAAFDDAHDYCFCEGMEDKKFSSFKGSDGKRFTLYISDDYELYTFFWLFRRERGITRKD